MVHSIFTVFLSFALLLHSNGTATSDKSPSYIEQGQTTFECLIAKDLSDSEDKSTGFAVEPVTELTGTAPFIAAKTQHAKYRSSLSYPIRAPPTA